MLRQLTEQMAYATVMLNQILNDINDYNCTVHTGNLHTYTSDMYPVSLYDRVNIAIY